MVNDQNLTPIQITNKNVDDVHSQQNHEASHSKSNANYAEIVSQSSKSVSANTIPNPKIPNSNPKPFKKVNKPDYSDDYLKTPKKDQGIIIESAEGIKILQYIEAVGDIVGPENIMYASRLSKDRICIYLNSNVLVNKITESYDVITINEIDLAVRPLILRATKYYLNRVCPSIPSSIVHDKISEIGINITSKIQREKMSYEANNYAHILSFRRTFYGIPEKHVTIPESFSLSHENESYRIFISNDIKRCDICHKIGHLTTACRNKTNVDNEQNNESQDSTTNLENMDFELCLSSDSLNVDLNEIDMIDTSHNTLNEARALQNQLSGFPSISHSSTQNNNNSETNKQNKKFTPPAEVANVQKLRKIYEEIISSTISFDHFFEFLSKMSKKEVNSNEIRANYSDETKELILIIESLRSVTQSATKARLTRTLYKIKNIFKLKSSPSLASELEIATQNVS